MFTEFNEFTINLSYNTKSAVLIFENPLKTKLASIYFLREVVKSFPLAFLNLKTL